MINIKRALGFCDEFLKYTITNEKLDYGPYDSLIHFSVYTYQGRCAKHGIIPNILSLCKLFEENYDINNDPRGLYVKRASIFMYVLIL